MRQMDLQWNLLMGNLGMQVQAGYYVSQDIKAGADFGTRLASPGPKANLVFPTTVGECANQEPPWCQVRVRYLGWMFFLSADRYMSAEAISEVVTVAKDCCSSSMDDMLGYYASICLYVGNKDVF